MANNIFVLCTGRCGSKTFTKACQHATNYTTSHEGMALRHNLDYPDNHIEVNNRLVWYLGLLDKKFPDARFVHLMRDPESTALSYAKKKAGNEFNIIRTWRSSIRMGWYVRQGKDEERTVLDDCREYVDAVNGLVSSWLAGHPQSWIRVFIEDSSSFERFWNWAGMDGDLNAALATFQKRFNANNPGNQCDPNRLTS